MSEDYRVAMSCPNAECGGRIYYRAGTENTGFPEHPAYTNYVEDAGKTCACDLSSEQWAALDDAAWKEACGVA